MNDQEETLLESEFTKAVTVLRKEYFDRLVKFCDATSEIPGKVGPGDWAKMLHLTSQYCETILHQLNALIRDIAMINQVGKLYDEMGREVPK
jgi:hypothetical protein